MKRLIKYFSVFAVLAALALPAQVWPLASFMPHPNPQYFNGGVPCANCKLYFYENNTTTLKATYTDASGTVQNPNPVPLNSKGEATSGIWLNGIYSVKLVTSLGATVWGPKNDIAGLADASLTGATLSQWQASGKVPTYINTTTFSTVGDNTSMFQTGRRLEITVSGGVRYGRIASSSYGAGVTQTVMELDSGTLDSGISQVNISLVTPTNRSLSYDMIASGQNSSNLSTSGVHTNSGTFVSSGSFTSTGSAAFSGTTSMTGTTNITGPTSISSATTSGTWTNNISSSGTHTILDGNTKFAVAAGTAPFSIPTTTTMVTGLNAQYLGGFLPSQTPGANNALVTNASGNTAFSSNGNVEITVSDGAGHAHLRTSRTTGWIVESKQKSTLYAGAYFDGTNNKYYEDGFASALELGKTELKFYLASTGLTNNNITWNGPYTVWHSGNDGPYFEVERNTGSQSVTTGTWTVVQYNSEITDSANAYSVASYRFNPQVAGMYSISTGIVGVADAGTLTQVRCGLSKNGSIYHNNEWRGPSGSFSSAIVSCATNIYLNGSTDYVDTQAYVVGTNPLVQFNTGLHFSGGRIK